MGDNEVILRCGLKMHLCDEGRELRKAWSDAVEAGTAEEIDRTARAYFIHKNGVTRKDGFYAIKPCGECGVAE